MTVPTREKMTVPMNAFAAEEHRGFTEHRRRSMLGRSVGPYLLSKVLGRGGMGTVYLGIRQDDLRMKVAVKLLRAEIGCEKLYLRFLNERRILAQLSHPNIAKLIDGGNTEEGIPYLVMEYVDGVPIDEYCQDRDLCFRERIGLFAKVCAAVGFAHRNQVAHRDLKPGNILVTREGEPMLLDFGIAKILDAPTEEPITRTGDYLLTPEYASPEQVLGANPSEHTDIYALGTLLYQLVTGELPHRFVHWSMAEYQRVICESDPIKPSKLIKNKGIAVTGPLSELDAIILKAMRKEPEHRYPSAAGIAEDLDHFLCGRAVGAKGLSWHYRMGKTIRRHKWAIVPVFGLAGFLVFACCKHWELQANRRLAEKQAQAAFAARKEAEANRSLAMEAQRQKEDLEEQANEIQLTLKQERDQARRAWVNEKKVREDVVDTLTTVENDKRQAERELQELELRQERARQTLAALELQQRQAEEAKRNAEQARIQVESALAEAEKERDAGKRMIAMLDRMFREAGTGMLTADQILAESRSVFSEETAADPSVKARLLNMAGAVYLSLGYYETAKPFLEEGLALRSAALGPDHPEVAVSLSNLGFLQAMNGDHAGAEARYLKALDIRRKAHGDEHESVATVLTKLAELYRQTGNYSRAAEYLQTALSVRLSLYGEGHGLVAGSLEDIAELYWVIGQRDQAVAMLQRAILIYRNGGENQEALDVALGTLEEYLSGSDARAQAVADAASANRDLFGFENPDLASDLENLARNAPLEPLPPPNPGRDGGQLAQAGPGPDTGPGGNGAQNSSQGRRESSGRSRFRDNSRSSGPPGRGAHGGGSGRGHGGGKGKRGGNGD